MKTSTLALIAVAAVVAFVVIRRRAEAARASQTSAQATRGTSRTSAENVPQYAGDEVAPQAPGSDVFAFLRSAQAYEYAMS